MKALLFLFGEPPKQLPNAEGYDVIACTDGAFHYLKDKDFNLELLTFISGDFDSHTSTDENLYHDKFIWTPNQDFTDFEKALDLLSNKGVTDVDVYGGSGKEMDHYLGNLSSAYYFKDRMNIVFFDEFSSYYFIPKSFSIDHVKGKMISLYPFPIAENVVTKGLNWSLNNETLSSTQRIGTRNFAKDDEVSIEYQHGDMLFFVALK